MEAYKQEFIEFMVASILESLQSPVNALILLGLRTFWSKQQLIVI